MPPKCIINQRGSCYIRRLLLISISDDKLFCSRLSYYNKSAGEVINDVSVYFLQKRRDRINKKMRALQELIPHCNKVLSFIKPVVESLHRIFFF